MDGLAQNAEARVTRTTIPILDRAALTPREFAGFFGRSQTWGYRRIYSGEVRVIRPGGRLLIPRDEVNKLLKGAAIYDGGASK